MTHRQFMAWIEWERMDWDVPDKHNWYQMMIGCEVRRVLLTDKNAVSAKDLTLKFIDPTPVTTPQGASTEKVKYQSRVAMSAAVARLGGNVTVNYVDKHGNPLGPPDGK